MNFQRILLNGGVSGTKIVANVYKPEIRESLLGQIENDSLKRVSLLLGHANSYLKELWNPIIRKINENIDVLTKNGVIVERIISFDYTHHGESAEYNVQYRDKYDQRVTWVYGARDLISIVRELGLDKNNCISIGHSYGACTALLAEIMCPALFRGMVAIEPVVGTNEAMAKSSFIPSIPKRKNAWRSPKEFNDYMKDKISYKAWTDECLELYSNYGLKKDGEGDNAIWKLRCDPVLEYQGYRGGELGAMIIMQNCHRVLTPVRLITGSKSTFNSPEAVRKFAETTPHCERVDIKGAGHLLVYEIPEKISELIIDYLSKIK